MKKTFLLLISLLLLASPAAWGAFSEYCNFVHTSGQPATTWQTDVNGNVVITMSDASGATNASWRNGGLEGGMGGFTVLSGEGFATSEDASTYFDRTGGATGDKVITLTLKNNANLPSPCKIHFQTNAFSWQCDENNNAYQWPTFTYTYGTNCAGISTPEITGISTTGRLSFTSDATATSHTAYIYDENGVLVTTQDVVTNDVLNLVPLSSGTYTVTVRSIKGDYASDMSIAYDWSVTAGHVYGKSKYCEWLWNTTANEGWPVKMTWTTEHNGDVTITLTPNGDEGAGATAFRGGGMPIDRFKVNGADASTYFSSAWSGNVVTLTKNATALVNGAVISYSGVVEYATGTHGNAWPTLNISDYAYGTKCVASDAVAPVITTFEKVSATTTSITFHVVATDVDDEGTPNELTYSISGNNGFVEQAVVLDASGSFTVSDLKWNTTYSFILTATDPSGNATVSASLSARVAYSNVNLALNRPSEAGIHQDANVASRANDGNESNFWTSFGQGTSDQWWWKVDLGQSFNINRVRILFNDHEGTYNVLTSDNGTDWSNYAVNFTIDNEHVDYTLNVVTSARYFKFTSSAANVGIKEFEVYGIGYNDGDTEAPAITAAALVDGPTDFSATVSVTATDNVGVYAIRFEDTSNSYNQTYEYVPGQNITITGLVPSTSYNLKLYALDRADNASAAFSLTAFTTQANDNVPHEAAPVPATNSNYVTSIYSDVYTSAVKTDFQWLAYNSSATVQHLAINGDNYTYYVCGAGGEFAIGVPFHKASDNSEGIHVKQYEYIHLDIWTDASWGVGVTLNDNRLVLGYQLAPGWNSIDIPLQNLQGGGVTAASVLESLRWMKFTEVTNHRLAIDNIYFWSDCDHCFTTTF